MGGCAAVNCSNHSRNKFRMFRFPTDEARRRKWAIFCRRDGWVPGTRAELCSVHFEESQYEQHRADNFKKLKPNAVPTLFDAPNPPTTFASKRIKGRGLPKSGSILDKTSEDDEEVNEGWKRIEAEMGIPVVELKKKKETLMTAFRSHLKKKKASIRSGAGEEDIYKPIWIFYDAMEIFLKDVYDLKSIVNNEEEVVHVDEDLELSGDNSIDLGPSQKERPEASQKESLPPRKRPATSPTELQEVNAKVNAVFQTLNEVLSKSESDSECELYGKLLAVKLKQFSPLQRTELMYEIDGLVMRKRQSMYSQSSTTQSPHSSTSSPLTPRIPTSSSVPTPKKESGDFQQQQRFYIAVPSITLPRSQDILSCESADVSEQEYVLPHNYTHK